MNLFLSFLGFAVLIAVFANNVIFLDSQKKLLSQKFDKWWKVVEHYNRTKLALVFAKKMNRLLDSTFGAKHFSKRLFFKSSIISSGFLLVTLSVLGMTHHIAFGVAPYTAYKDSIKLILTTTEELGSKTNYATLLNLALTSAVPQIQTKINSMIHGAHSNYYLVSRAPEWNSNAVILHLNSNDLLFKVTTNGLYDIQKVEPVGHGWLNVSFGRRFGGDTGVGTNSVGDSPSGTNTFDELRTNLMSIHDRVAHYNSGMWMQVYSVGFYITIFVVNIFMFIASLAFGRTILREIANSRRIITTCALVFTNFFFVFTCCCNLVLALTLFAIPVFWLLIPVLYQVSSDSLYFTLAFLLSAAIAILMSIGNSTKIILFIALLPSCLAILVGLFSLFAIRWRNQFHFVVKHLLIRCAEKNPFVVLIGIITLVSGLIALATNLIHFLGFL